MEDNNSKKAVKKPYSEMTPEEKEATKKATYRFIGFVAALFGKAFLQEGGCEVDFKINGEDIEKIRTLDEFGLKERLDLAILEERFEDAAKFKKMLDAIRNFNTKKTVNIKSQDDEKEK